MTYINICNQKPCIKWRCIKYILRKKLVADRERPEREQLRMREAKGMSTKKKISEV